ncbi:MAG: AEC family transporter [Erysipelotrichaceae bacterium]|nr:AEC family transporter [Erysipelotrichaceae bacterium]
MDFSKLFNLQFMMFAEMTVGYMVCKMQILKPSERSVLSKLCINVFLPCNIMSAFNMELSEEIINCFLQIFLVSCGIQVVCTLIAKLGYNWVEEDKKPVMQYATVCSNAGFLGNPVAEGVYGSLGLLYGQIYLIPLRIVMWTAGVSFFAKEGKQHVIKTIVTHPCIIALGIGLLRMGLQVSVPSMIDSTLSSLGKCATPCIMVFLGMILYDIGFKDMISKENVIFSCIRLVLIPAIVLGLCIVVHIDPMITGLSVILAAMPAGSTTAVLADQYHRSVDFAANCVVLTTMLSIALLPVWVMIVQLVI